MSPLVVGLAVVGLAACRIGTGVSAALCSVVRVTFTGADGSSWWDSSSLLLPRSSEDSPGSLGDEFIAADYVMYPIASGLQPGPKGTKQAITTYRTAFPDLQVTVDDVFAADDRVALRWSFRGTHLGDWLGVPPTGNHMAATGISVYRIARERPLLQ
jgi:hypothetical protein